MHKNNMPQILLGPGGTAGLGYEKGLLEAHRLGFTALECEFTHGISLSNEKAKEIGELARKYKITLSVHAPYFINLASAKKEKIAASKKRILDSCERAHYLGAKYVIFHAAYYCKRDKEEIYHAVKAEMLDMQKAIKKNKWNAVLAPETTGKPSQFGSLDELKRLSDETGCAVCIDFAHILAREGSIDYKKILPIVKEIKQKTSHFSGINYGPSGEKNHEVTPSSEIEKLLKALVKHGISIAVINESPEPFKDSIKARDILERIAVTVKNKQC